MTDARQPDEIIEPGSPSSRMLAHRPVLREVALALPNIAKLFVRLARDPRVPVRVKTFAGIVGLYLVSPIDLIPDFIPVIGKTDDVVLAAFTFSQVVQAAGHSVVREYWDGSDDTLDVIIDAVDFAAGFVPRTMRLALRRYLRS